ncbi:MAG: nitroreductase family protein [Bdellovibrionales bacterium]|nr:nitroreductase family protein [Bdellovibrionales bacterium]
MNAILLQMKNHRSIRKYKNQDVSDEIINKILEASIMASSSGNMQSFSIIVTKDKDIKQKLLAPHFNQEMVTGAPVLITFCADFHRMRLWLGDSSAPMNFDNFMSFMIASIDAILVSQNVALAAESMGLGICYMGTTLASCDQIGEILGCPDHVVPVVGFSMGYADEAPSERKRLPLSSLVHYETYKDYSQNGLQEAYAERETLGWKRYLDDPTLNEMIKKSDVKNLAQVYTKLKYTRESHLDYSKTVLGYLEKSGFFNNN